MIRVSRNPADASKLANSAAKRSRPPAPTSMLRSANFASGPSFGLARTRSITSSLPAPPTALRQGRKMPCASSSSQSCRIALRISRSPGGQTRKSSRRRQHSVQRPPGVPTRAWREPQHAAGQRRHPAIPGWRRGCRRAARLGRHRPPPRRKTARRATTAAAISLESAVIAASNSAPSSGVLCGTPRQCCRGLPGKPSRWCEHFAEGWTKPARCTADR